MAKIEIRPFLELEEEGISCNILNTNCKWMGSIKGWWSHDYDRTIELVINTNLIPCSIVRLIDLDRSKFCNGISFDLSVVFISIEIFVCEVLPFALVN